MTSNILTIFGFLIFWSNTKSWAQVVFPTAEYSAVTESATGCACLFDPLEQYLGNHCHLFYFPTVTSWSAYVDKIFWASIISIILKSI